MMCSSDRMNSPYLAEAIKSADFNISLPNLAAVAGDDTPITKELAKPTDSSNFHNIMAKDNVIITSNPANLPAFLDWESTQIINFGTGIEFLHSVEELPTDDMPSAVVLPCIFGTQLQGPVLLATGHGIVVVVDERMTDNARNIASSYSINAFFNVQLNAQKKPKDTDDVLSLMNSANINGVIALAGL
ncbi:hypothetical protein QQS21_007312 [Conoideocrella luteorostrata]|uniref:Uncharacterized protein n=1 Tax=Conoideocrella luteorostrata TaxID=1105319 RepID=A0AAJ0CL25_9HYPO|nr:hypothetical protein QQS21_007312 [Conoideocrella luteorostrata]